jgi:sodium/pantothenate symporter
MSSAITLILGVLLLLAAWRPPEMIIWLNLLAFGGLEAVFLWPLVLGLYWERANAAGALSAMIVGGVLYAVLATFKIQYLGFHPIVPSLLLSLLAFLVGNLFGRPVAEGHVITSDK